MASLVDPPSRFEKPPISEDAIRIVWALAWPAVALNSLQVMNTLLDRAFLGTLHFAALTAHGGATNVMFFMFSLAVAVSTGATAIVSRAFGAGDQTEFQKAAQQSLRVAIVGGFVVALITALISRHAASFVLPANDSEAQHEMTRFVLAYAAGLPAHFIIQVLAGSLRGIGDTKSPMVISGIQIFTHMILNFLLVICLKVGLVGAAIALSISAWGSAIAYVIYAGKTPLGVLNPFKLPEWDWSRRILRIAVPAGTMASLRVLSLTAFTLVLKQVAGASGAIAAMSIGFAIESIMFMPAFGLASAAAALVGQSLGMKDPARAERLGWIAGHSAAIVTIAMVVPIYIFAPNIAGFLVGNKPEIAYQAGQLLHCLCVTEFLFAYSMVMIGAMQGAGDTVRPFWISVISLWGMRVPFAMFMALPPGFLLGGAVPLPFAFGMGPQGAWLAMSFTQGIQGVFGLIAFKQGAWKTQKV